MIAIGDFVRVVGSSDDFTATGFSSATGQFLVRSLKGPIKIMSVDVSRLELVAKAPVSDSGGPVAMPERWITD
jgi:hypothetical protein